MALTNLNINSNVPKFLDFEEYVNVKRYLFKIIFITFLLDL